jgi:predicted O-methyltransferase YrrM
LLDELYRFGQEHDARQTERGRRMLNITPETGLFLGILLRALGARNILEVGTSNGYSTIWLADAARETGGHVTTIEAAADKAEMARANFARAGLAEHITVCLGNALDVLATHTGPFDLIFLDADRPNYLRYLELLLPLLRPGGLLVTDNVVSHAHELTDFLARLKMHPLLMSVTLPLGNGEELTLKMRPEG